VVVVAATERRSVVTADEVLAKVAADAEAERVRLERAFPPPDAATSIMAGAFWLLALGGGGYLLFRYLRKRGKV
jgi:hypothetical protein